MDNPVFVDTKAIPVVFLTRLKLKPGQKGTKKLLEKHGEALFCVRYRYDEASRMRIKTVELIVERTAWRPPARKFGDNDLVPFRIGYTEKDLIESAKTAKGMEPRCKVVVHPLWYD